MKSSASENMARFVLVRIPNEFLEFPMITHRLSLTLATLATLGAAPAHADPPSPTIAAFDRATGSHGELQLAAGALGVTVPGTATGVLGGAMVSLAYDAPGFALLLDGRVAFGATASDATTTGDDSTLRYLSVSTGFRRYLTVGGVAPFIGAGLAYSDLQYDDRLDNPFAGGAAGLGGYAELGLVAFRDDATQLSVGLRADLPFYEVVDDRTLDARYLLPLGVTAALIF